MERFDPNLREHYIRQEGGDSPTFYIMRRNPMDMAGLFAYYVFFAGQIRNALSKGYIPVVDMQNYPNIYLEPNLVGKENAWEYYFRQPVGVTLEEAYNGKNVLLASAIWRDGEERPGNGNAFFDNVNGVLTEWRMLVKLGLLQVQPKLYEEIISLRNKMFAPNDRVLGVHLRGTDYVARRPQGHYIQPPIEYAITKVIEKLNEWHCNKIFLTTEDVTIAATFKRIFGDICATIEKGYVKYDEKRWVTECLSSDENYRQRGIDYVTETVILSTCNCLVAGKCGATVGALMMGNFENTYTFNFGKYGMIGLN